MKQTKSVPPENAFQAMLVIFVVASAQTGIGLAVFQRFVYAYAKQDAWIAVIAAALFVHLTLFVILRTLRRYGTKDLFEIHHAVFGKWAGGALNLVWMIYCFYALLMVTATYYEILATYLFPEIPNWFVSALLIILTVYTVSSGIRVIVGFCFFSIIISIPLLLVLYQIVPYMDLRHFFPPFEAAPMQVLRASYEMSLSLAGFELIYFYYPYIKPQEQAGRYAQMGAGLTNAIFLFVILISIGFFGGGDLLKSAWPTMSLYKVIKFPFLEQVQVALLCIFMAAILPILCLYIWSLTKGLKKQFGVPQRQMLLAVAGALFLASLAFQTRQQIYNTGTLFNRFAFVMIFIYPYVLFVLSWIVGKVKERQKRRKQPGIAENSGESMPFKG
ncbi:GerAB/ArcD/ProY family transporter [Ectobacillus ponti]|uniref:Spore germination protein n=1 Tax=Ectobacillus ponti TaxID=2961894 RepID=A0AA41X624_9BACI|nr:GerAB/ArcD/ProY family transporter [Ectobacillus ponti]MCP8966983.1 spore germination protein [Ectobacillus ponti]